MPRPFTLVQLHYFCAVARAGTMTAAAAQLTVAQSTLSSALQDLEAAMATPLFNRTPRRTLELTPAGRRLLGEATRVLEDAEQLPRIAQGNTRELSGRLTIGVFSPLASTWAPRLLSDLADNHPGLAVTFIEGDQEELRQSLIAGRCDVALMYGVGLDDQFLTAPVSTVPPHVLVAHDHPIAAQESVRLGDLVELPLVLLDLPHSRDYYLRLFAAEGLRPRVDFRLPSYEAVRSFVACGHGYAVLNQVLPHRSTHAGRDVARVVLAGAHEPIRTVVAFPLHQPMTRKADMFERACHRVMQEWSTGTAPMMGTVSSVEPRDVEGDHDGPAADAPSRRDP